MGPLALSLLVCIILVTLLGIEVRRRLHKNVASSVPTVRPLRSYKDFLIRTPRRDRQAAYLADYGEVYQVNLLGQWVVQVANPDLAKVCLVDRHRFEKATAEWRPWIVERFTGKGNLIDTNGEQWRRHKSICGPAFKYSNLQRMVPAFGKSALLLCDSLDKLPRQEDGVLELDVVAAIQRTALDVLGRAGFGGDFGISSLDNLEANAPAAQLYNHIFSRLLDPVHLLTATATGAQHALPVTRRLEDSIKQFNTVIYDIINKRRKALAEKHRDGEPDKSDPQEPTTLLDMLIEATLDEENDSTLSQEELRNNMLLFFVAGHETTSTSLLVALHALSLFPEQQERIREECRAVMGEERYRSGAPATFDEQKRFDYMDCVIKEGLRYYPPAQGTTVRRLTEDMEWNGLQFAAGTKFSVDILALHHHPQLYDNPEDFDPSRWENGAHPQHPMAYIPFGGGQRACIGRQFSLMEQRVVLQALLRRYQVLPISNAGRVDDLKTAPGPLMNVKSLHLRLQPLS